MILLLCKNNDYYYNYHSIIAVANKSWPIYTCVEVTSDETWTSIAFVEIACMQYWYTAVEVIHRLGFLAVT